LVISAFGLSKLIGNIPSGYLVEKYGRKAMLVSGLAMCGVGIGSIGLTLMPDFGTPWLVGCRFASGLGVSAFVAGVFIFVQCS
jgi:MFS family permease